MKWMVCIDNTGYAASLEARKLYRVQEDETVESLGFFRILDESGEDYLYPQTMFLPLSVPAPLEERLLTV